MSIPKVGHERRRYDRCEICTEIIIFGANKSFRTTTQNISLCGALLSGQLPLEMKSEVVDIVIIANRDGVDRRILLRGVLIDPQGPNARLDFVNTPTLQFLKLQDFVRQAAAS